MIVRKEFEIKFAKFFSLHRSQNQHEDDFENFCDNFRRLAQEAISATNPFFTVAICDLNATSINWYTGDTTIFGGSKSKVLAFNLCYTKMLMNQLTFRKNLHPVSTISLPLSQTW